jgi:hypothetical protein
MGISVSKTSRIAPVYIRRSDTAFISGANTNVVLTGTNANVRIWGYRIYPNCEQPIIKYGFMNNSGTAFSQSAGTGAIKAAIYQVNSLGLPTTKLSNSDAEANITTLTYTSTSLVPVSSIDMPNPLAPLLLCWVSNLNSVTITNGGSFMSSYAVNIGDLHPYYAPGFSYGLDLEITVGAFVYNSFVFPDDFSSLNPSLISPRNNNSLCNMDWILSHVV